MKGQHNESTASTARGCPCTSQSDMNVSVITPVDMHRENIRRHMNLRIIRPIYTIGLNFCILKFLCNCKWRKTATVGGILEIKGREEKVTWTKLRTKSRRKKVIIFTLGQLQVRS